MAETIAFKYRASTFYSHAAASRDKRLHLRLVLKTLRLSAGILVGASTLTFVESGSTVIGGPAFSEEAEAKEEDGSRSPDCLLSQKIERAQFSPDGRLIVTERLKTARIWDASTGKHLHALQHKSWIRRIAFSPDGKTVLTASFETARIWDAATGQMLHALRGGGKRAAFSPDGKTVLTHSNEAAHLWNAATGHQLWAVDHPKLENAVFSPDGKLVLTLNNTARIWDAATGAMLHELPIGRRFARLVFSPDGRFVLIYSRGGQEGARIWDIATGERVHTLGKYGSKFAAFSPDGKTVLTGSSTVRLWDAATGDQLWEVDYGAPVEDGAFSPDGQTVLILSLDLGDFSFPTGGEVYTQLGFRDTATGEMLKMVRAEGQLVFADYPADGKTVLTTSLGPAGPSGATIWDAVTGEMLAELRGVLLAVSPDGRFALTGIHPAPTIWDAATGEKLQNLGC